MRKIKDLYTRNLFEVESDLRFIRLAKDDVVESSDKIRLLSTQISKHEEMYPNIDNWLKSKVLTGIKEKNRVAYIGLNNDIPIASAVLKLGSFSKFCHLHIDQEYQNQNIGELLFSMMALDARRRANEVHFTLPESLWIDKGDFFRSFGFQEAKKSKVQYRSYEDELRCTTSFSTVWNSVLEKLPKIITSLTKTHDDIFSGILISIKPAYVEKIMSGEKLIEIRKRFSTKWIGCRITIYSSSPTQAIYGYATIDNVKKDSPETIWSQFGQHIGASKQEYDAYLGASKQVYAISLKDFQPYHNPIPLSQIEGLLNHETLKPPQSYTSLSKNINWARAISIAELLHNRFWTYRIAI